jgi:hypothetical protein
MSKRKRSQHIVATELESLVETVTPSASRAELFKFLTQVQSLIATAKLHKVENKVGMPSMPRPFELEANDTFSSLKP